MPHHRLTHADLWIDHLECVARFGLSMFVRFFQTFPSDPVLYYEYGLHNQRISPATCAVVTRACTLRRHCHDLSHFKSIGAMQCIC